MADGVKVDIRGIKEFVDAIDANIDAMRDALAKGLWEAAKDIGDRSQDLAPIDTGNLKGSMRREPNDKHMMLATPSPEVTINYTAPYALFQHENLNLSHPSRARGGAGPTAPGTPGGSPKYLEFPFMEEVGHYPRRLVERVRAEYHAVQAKGID
jgi:hypothetical protein